MPRVERTFPIGPFGESATRWLAAPTPEDEHATPARAATVMLVRGAPVEVFMIERASTMDFAPSTWVFPGGRVDRQDAAVVAAGLLDGDPDAMGARLGVEPALAADVVVCALRELYEEAGVLLVAADDGSAAVADDVRRRGALERHETSFREVLGERRLLGDAVVAVDRWLTPPFESRRFDTWFFTAMLPLSARAEAVSRESQRGRWVRPSEMLSEMEAGAVKLLPPTRTALERLARSGDAETAMTQARAAAFEPTRPVAVMGESGPYLRATVNL